MLKRCWEKKRGCQGIIMIHSKFQMSTADSPSAIMYLTKLAIKNIFQLSTVAPAIGLDASAIGIESLELFFSKMPLNNVLGTSSRQGRNP